MLDLGFLILLTLSSAGLGLWLLHSLDLEPSHPSDALALSLPLGLGLIALAVFALALIGTLNTLAILILLVLVGLLGATSFFHHRPFRQLISRTTPLELPDRALLVLLLVAILGTLLSALAPVTDGDALCYHLQVPKLFLERGASFYDPDLHETVYPLLTEMLYTLALAVRGPVACRLVEWLLGLVFALNVNALARPTLGPNAWWAGAIALLVPAINNGMTAPLNDVSLAAFATAALFAWSRFRDQPSFPAAALTGILTGLALGVKYPALVLAGLIGIALLFEILLPKPLRSSTESLHSKLRLRHLILFAAFAFLIGGGWYLRAYAHTGNPVHPFFRSTFGGAGLVEVLGIEKRPLPRDPWHLLTALAPLTLHPDAFDSFSHQFGPVFLLFLPALLLEKPPRRILALAALGYSFLTLCITQRQSMRFLLIAIGPMSIAVAWLAQTWWSRRTLPGRALVAFLLLALAFESTLAIARARHVLPVVLGFESTDHYLARTEPTYRVGQWVGANLPESARLVGQDHRGFYLPRPYTMELAHRRRTHLGQLGETPEQIIEHLRQAGFTHLLLCPPHPETPVEFDPTLTRLIAPWLAAEIPLFQRSLSDADGVIRHYSIYDLTDTRIALREDIRR